MLNFDTYFMAKQFLIQMKLRMENNPIFKEKFMREYETMGQMVAGSPPPSHISKADGH